MINQAFINIIVIVLDINNLLRFILSIAVGVVIFVALRLKVEGKERLFKKAGYQ